MLTMPVVGSTGTNTRFGTVWPATQVIFAHVVRAAPVVHTVRNLGAVVWVAVTFRIAAATPMAGTPVAPPVPVTLTSRVAPAASGLPALACPLPARVSVIRYGVSPTWPPAELVGEDSTK